MNVKVIMLSFAPLFISLFLCLKGKSFFQIFFFLYPHSAEEKEALHQGIPLPEIFLAYYDVNIV